MLVASGIAGIDADIPPPVLTGGIDIGTLPADAASGSEGGRPGIPVETEDGVPVLTDEGMPAVALPPEPGLPLPARGRLAGIQLLAFVSACSLHRSAPGTDAGRLSEQELLVAAELTALLRPGPSPPRYLPVQPMA